ncbi:MAG: hypothetical protein JSU90_05255 [Nitrospiraceae bacterium]|nr:MAG: hypothetical protein JSU90_05255 [Nitrospiraceae bacterium]
MKKIAVLTPLDAEFGFGLAGVSHRVTRAKDVEGLLRKIIGEPDTGLFIIDEQLLKAIPDERLKEIEKSWHGVLVVLPSPERAEAEVEDYALRLIRRAIGYHVRLQV